MARLPKKCLVDTNVPVTANKATNPSSIPDELVDCVNNCLEAIEHVVSKRGLVIDSGDEIFDEYRKNLSLKGQPGPGDRFIKWVHDNRWNLPKENRVSITKRGDSYLEFPSHGKLSSFDPSDRKFIAVANAHPHKPPILQATDSKWWEYKDALVSVGIQVRFLCKSYIKKKFEKKTRT
ncbi:MAG: hypothetical protein IT426_07600 [Pirellulales bacterium]|nr:hypothetical protein [Pirellulales bacterium]